MTTAPDASPTQLLTVAEARAQLRIGLAKFYELVNSGELKTVLLPNARGETAAPRRVGERGPKPSRRIEQAEIDAFIARHRQPS